MPEGIIPKNSKNVEQNEKKKQKSAQVVWFLSSHPRAKQSATNAKKRIDGCVKEDTD